MIKIEPAVFALAESGTPSDLKLALQHAVQLEHATMPPYLYALYSLGSSNPEMRTVLLSILMDEMTHMLLAGNIMKAIGGSPNIYDSQFVPKFPTHLPGSVAGDFIVPLKRFSKELVEKIFMRIEEPEHILDFPVVELANGKTEPPPKTIGEFYRRIRQTFEDCGDEIIVDKTGATQPTTDFFDLEQKITTAKQAVNAIDLIVEQGEGTTEDPHFPDDDSPHDRKLAHYYSFAELVKGKLEPNPDATPQTPPSERYVFNKSKPVPFDESAVLPFPDNPKSVDFAEGTSERLAVDKFNRSYSKMLKRLHQAFNGNPSRLDDAIGEMQIGMTESAQALQMLKIGPSFEFVEV